MSGPGPLPLSLAPFLLSPSEFSPGPTPTSLFFTLVLCLQCCGLFAQADGGAAAGVRIEVAHSAVERALEARPHPRRDRPWHSSSALALAVLLRSSAGFKQSAPRGGNGVLDIRAYWTYGCGESN